MREVRKNIYNVSRPDHFGSIRKMPVPVGQLPPEDTLEAALREFMEMARQKDKHVNNVLEEKVDPVIAHANQRGKRIALIGDGNDGSLKVKHQLKGGKNYTIEIMGKDLADVLEIFYGDIGYKIDHDGKDVFLTW